MVSTSMLHDPIFSSLLIEGLEKEPCADPVVCIEHCGTILGHCAASSDHEPSGVHCEQQMGYRVRFLVISLYAHI